MGLNLAEAQELHECVGAALETLRPEGFVGTVYVTTEVTDLLARARELAAVLVSDAVDTALDGGGSATVDPDQVLALARKASDDVDAAADDEMLDPALEALAAYQTLDEQLSAGGPPPTAWAVAAGKLLLDSQRSAAERA